MAALDVIEPHLMLTSDHGQVAKDVVATVLREAHRRRGWVHGDPEPIDAGQIIDCQGDRWARDDLGLWVYSEAPLTSTWAELLDSFGPLVEVTR